MLTSHFPHRWKDLQLYQLLILWTYRQFTGRVWLAYDRAFREHAAVTNLTDWSTLNAQLFNLHAAGASVRGHNAITDSTEPRGVASSTNICRLWNRGIRSALRRSPRAVLHTSARAALAIIASKIVPGIRPPNSVLSPIGLQPLLQLLAASLGDCERLERV